MHILEKESGVNIGGVYCLKDEDVLVSVAGLMKLKGGLIIVSYCFLSDADKSNPTWVESITFKRLYNEI